MPNGDRAGTVARELGAGPMKGRGSRTMKRLDRLLGIPALRLLGAFPRRQRPEAVRRVGLLKTAAVGDTLFLAGIMRDLAAAFPQAQITLVTGTDNATTGAMLAKGIGDHIWLNPRNPASAIATLRGCRFDILIDTGSWPRLDAFITALSGARFRVGFRTAGQARHYAYDLVVDHSPERHEIDNYRALIAAIGAPSAGDPVLRLSGLPTVRDLPPKPFLVIHPWSGGFLSHFRSWPADRWVELVQRVRHNVATVVISAAHSQRAAGDAMAAELARRGVAVVVRSDGIPETAALLLEAAAVVGVNTSVPHMASLLGVPSVCLDGPTHPSRWGLAGPRSRAVVTDLPGCGYLYLGFEYEGQRPDCMLGVRVDAVERALCELTGWTPSTTSGA